MILPSKHDISIHHFLEMPYGRTECTPLAGLWFRAPANGPMVPPPTKKNNKTHTANTARHLRVGFVRAGL